MPVHSKANDAHQYRAMNISEFRCESKQKTRFFLFFLGRGAKNVKIGKIDCVFLDGRALNICHG